MRYYSVNIRVTEDRLTTVLDVLRGACEIVNVAPEVTKHRATPRFVNGKRNKGISGIELALGILEAGAASEEQLKSMFVERGFADTSCSSVLSKLRQAKKIDRNPQGLWYINGA